MPCVLTSLAVENQWSNILFKQSSLLPQHKSTTLHIHDSTDKGKRTPVHKPQKHAKKIIVDCFKLVFINGSSKNNKYRYTLATLKSELLLLPRIIFLAMFSENHFLEKTQNSSLNSLSKN